ncbi:MAG: hypothetical protein ACMUIA_09110 [bacterium]
MKRVWYIAFHSLLILTLLCLQGCGDINLFEDLSDSDGYAATIEQIKRDLNAGDFDSVIDYLGPKDPASLSEQEVRYLASAYVGKAGFDTLTLLEEIAEDADLFDVITGIFDDDGNGAISYQELADKIALIDEALVVLSAADPNFSQMTQLGGVEVSIDIRVQRGIYAIVHAILSLPLAVYEKYSLDYELDSVPLTQEALSSLSLLLPGQNILLEDSDVPLEELNRDLRMIADGIEALVSGDVDAIAEDPTGDEQENDVQRELDEFLELIHYSDDDYLNGNDISLYLNNMY